MSISFCIYSHVLILFERLQEVATDKGPWAWLSDKSNASRMQKHIVPWLIAMYGLSYAKTASNAVVRQMVIALFDEHEYLQCSMTAQEAAAKYNCALNDAIIHVKHAAGMSLNAHPHLLS